MNVKKMYRKTRYNVCRAIYYADQCPVGYKKDYKKMFTNGLYTIALVFATIAILFGLLVMF